MNLDKLNKWLTLAANIGVIAGIVFLGIEINQNNEFMAAQQRFNQLSISTGTSTMIVENPQLAELLSEANQQSRVLTPSEKIQLQAFYERAFSNMQWTYFELPENELPVKAWQVLSNGPRNKEYWKIMRPTLDEEFIHYIEFKTNISK